MTSGSPKGIAKCAFAGDVRLLHLRHQAEARAALGRSPLGADEGWASGSTTRLRLRSFAGPDSTT